MSHPLKNTGLQTQGQGTNYIISKNHFKIHLILQFILIFFFLFLFCLLIAFPVCTLSSPSTDWLAWWLGRGSRRPEQPKRVSSVRWVVRLLIFVPSIHRYKHSGPIHSVLRLLFFLPGTTNQSVCVTVGCFWLI